ncbi:MAG TPA: hypothetical protein DFS52_22570 [Myxococcales bacterium]|nr:hypothetical protein [Myxococcales bacterium]
MIDLSGQTRVYLAWYKRNQWPRLREMSAEPDRLAATYDEWLVDAKGQLQELRAQKIAVSRVVVDVEELLAWCERQGRKVEPAAAAEFAASLAQQGRGLLGW